LRASFKASSGAFFSKKWWIGLKWKNFYSCGSNVKLGLFAKVGFLIIFGEFSKKKFGPSAFAFRQSFMKKLTKF
jgi:hypothetical protein